jgi:amidase
MKFPLPTDAQVRESADALGLHLTDAYVDSYRAYIGPFVEAYNQIGSMPERLPVADYPRGPAYRPAPEDNPHNAWYYKCHIRGASEGKLKGKTFAVKDNTCVAGVPMMNGASVLEGYSPETDATVVVRLLDAGAEFLGKATCEYFSFASGSATSATGPVDNPRNPGHTPGGSSTGSGALVAAGEVDLAIGADQAGSVRFPACYSGIVGMKPTHGLVPYTGMMAVEATIDHAGVLTKTVADNALCLEVIAGEDGLDYRQHAPRVERYTEALAQGAEGLRIALLTEGFGGPLAEPDVDEAVRAGGQLLASLGCTVDEVSIPWHSHGVAIWAPICIEGTFSTMFLNGGVGSNFEGVYVTSLVKALSDMHRRADEFPDTFKVVSLFGHHVHRYHSTRFYAKAQNLRRQLRAAYARVLEDYDLLVMPTTPMRAPKIPPPDAPFEEVMQHSWQNLANTCPFDVTGHPALSVPCGPEDGLAIGMMLVGRHFEDSTVYRAAHAFEQARVP